MCLVNLSLASSTTSATVTQATNHAITERSIPSEYPGVNYYEKYNAQTGKYDKIYYDSASIRFNRPYSDGYNYNPYYLNYYNPYTRQYESGGFADRYHRNRYDDGQYYPYKYSELPRQQYDDGQYRPGKYENRGQNQQQAYDDGQYRPGKYENPRQYTVNSFPYKTGGDGTPYVPKIQYVNEGRWNILRDDRYSDQNGYHYAYETQNGIRAAEDAHIASKDANTKALRKTGFYEYVGDDGKTYRVDYVADEFGYRAYVSIS